MNMQPNLWRTVNIQLPEIVFGIDAIENLPTLLAGQGCREVLIVTDKGLRKSGVIQTIEQLLSESIAALHIFDEVESDPNIENLTQCRAFAGTKKLDGIVGIGGGSSLDIAKVTAALYGLDCDIRDFFGHNKIPAKGLYSILIPTTAGTGSEVAIGAVISDEENKLKKGILSPHLLCAAAVLDPKLTQSCPPLVTAAAGLDALTHAIEVYTNKKAVQFIDTLVMDAIEAIWNNLSLVFADGTDMTARSQMLLAAMQAGIGMQAVNNAAVHALGAPLGALYHIPHGVVNSFLLPYVMEFNKPDCVSKYSRLAKRLGLADGRDEQNASILVRELITFIRSFEIGAELADITIRSKDIPAMAELSLEVWLMANNPKQVGLNEAIAIYEKAFSEEGIKVL